MKYFPSILSALILFFLAGALVSSAQGYVPLAPLPGTLAEGGKTTNLSSYLSGMIKLLIALGAATSILFAIIGGTQFVAAGISPDAKNGAKEKIMNSFIGLAIILTSYLLLNSINPKLVEFNLLLDKVTPAELKKDVTAGTWGDDSGVRSVLADGTSIRVKEPTCRIVDQKGCTSVFGLNQKAIIGLRNLDKACKEWAGFFGGCEITVTGGTEYWAHKTHNTGTRVDLRKSGTLDGFIVSKGKVSMTECGVASDPHYMPAGFSGGVYVDEPDRDSTGEVTGEGRHWHVCYEI